MNTLYHKKLSVLMAIAAGLTLLLLGACAKGDSQSATAGWSATGSVVFLEGDVRVNADTAEVGTVVPRDAEIQTGPASQVEITFGSANIIRIGENSVISLGLVSDGPGIVDIRSGSMAAVLYGLNKLDNKDSMTIRTNTSVAGVRGTAFYAKVENPNETYFCLCNGALTLGSPEASQPEQIEAEHHQAFILKSGSQELTPAPMEYHTDAEMNALAAKIGVTIDWSAIHRAD